MTEIMDHGELLVADSFRVRENDGQAEVRAFHLHRERFTRNVLRTLHYLSLAEERLDQGQLHDFFTEVPDRIQAFGSGFPRIELRLIGSQLFLNLNLRPFPQLTDQLKLRTCLPSKQIRPDIKGPNINYYRELNAQLSAEALLCTPEGSVLEGATTSLLWWKEETLNQVTSHTDGGATLSRVNSITESLVFRAATELQYRTSAQDISSVELASYEVWAVNALHGIRPVSHLNGVALAVPDNLRLQRFQRTLDKYWQPVCAQFTIE